MEALLDIDVDHAKLVAVDTYLKNQTMETGSSTQAGLNCITLQLQPWNVKYILPLSKVNSQDKLLEVLLTLPEIAKHLDISDEELYSHDYLSLKDSRDLSKALLTGKWYLTCLQDCKVRFQDWSDLLHDGIIFVLHITDSDNPAQNSTITAPLATSKITNRGSERAPTPQDIAPTPQVEQPELIGWDSPPNPDIDYTWDNPSWHKTEATENNTANNDHTNFNQSEDTSNNDVYIPPHSAKSKINHDYEVDDWKLLNENPNAVNTRREPFKQVKPIIKSFKVPPGPHPAWTGTGQPFHFVIFYDLRVPIEFPFDRASLDPFDKVYPGDIAWWNMIKHLYYKFYYKSDKSTHYAEQELRLTRLVMQEVDGTRQLVPDGQLKEMGAVLIRDLGLDSQEKHYFLLE